MNPVYPLKLHDNLKGGYFKPINMFVKLKSNHYDTSTSWLDGDLDGVLFHTLHDEEHMSSYLKHMLNLVVCCTWLIRCWGGGVSLLQLVISINNVGERASFAFSRQT
jgi:hypothetical protein